ncbi:MAG: hypothetical protein KDD11_13455 [Acidobacteria bacterium]|nr:hypothetical protein [Acidobacteriota bacterium]
MTDTLAAGAFPQAAERIPEEAYELHRRLSGVAERFLRFAAETPGCLEAASFPGLHRPADPIYRYPLQPWPTFVARRLLAEMTASNLRLCRLIKELPQRIFGGQPDRLAEFYGLDAVQTELVAAALAAGPSSETLVARGDYVMTSAGLRCLEVNFGANLGGWELGMLTGRYREVEVLRSFLDGHAPAAASTDTLGRVLVHLLEVFEGLGEPDADVCRVAFLAPKGFDPHENEPSRVFFERAFCGLLARSGRSATGEVRLCLYDQLETASGVLKLDGERVHVVLEQHPLRYDGRILECLERRTVVLVNGPLKEVLDEKRNLALLSDPRYRDVFDDEERRLIDSLVPWTRVVADRRTELGGREWNLPDLLLEQRERLVLKRGRGLAGLAVHLGVSTPEPEWREKVERALAEGGWVVQELVRSEPFIYQHGDVGCAPHDVVWGLFDVGGRHGGGFLRLMPQGRGLPVNTNTGAREGILLEVPE